jgi:exopolysaccharide biosynthesis polyprenyl glycosylphosphotransferase
MGTAATLIVIDSAVVAGSSFAAGSTWLATLTRAVMMAVLLAGVGLYRSRLQFSALDDLPRILLAVGFAVPAGVWLPVPELVTPPAFTGAPFCWPLVVVGCIGVDRAVVYAAVRSLRRHRAGGEPTIVVGSGEVAVQLVEVLNSDSSYGMTPIGLVGPMSTVDKTQAPRLGPIHELGELVARHQPRNVIVTVPESEEIGLINVLRQCLRAGIAVFVVPSRLELASGRSGAELVRGIPLIRLRPEPPQLRRWVVKRAIDVIGAAVGLLVLTPVLVFCALAVRLESGRTDVLFRQERIGAGGKPFTIMKFRSLTPSTEQESQTKWTVVTDSRIGPVGRVLRSTSLDELPQLLNVLRGQMSLVGPRPERPYFVEQFKNVYADYADRHRVPAGITGWAQVNGLRGDTSIAERVRFDNYYIENWSLGLDLKIITRTVGSMVNLRWR